MTFAIQVSNPRLLLSVDEGDETVREAIESIFPMYTEYAVIIWNNLFVPVSYKYDISVMYDDVYSMLNLLLTSDDGHYSVQWGSNTFRAIWNLHWSNLSLSVSTRWESVIGSLEPLLNQSNILELDLRSFLAEWKQLLVVLLRSLESAGYNEKRLTDFHSLRDLVTRLPEIGLLYRK